MLHIIAASSDPLATGNNPVVRWFLLFLGVGGVILALRGVRNARSWLLLATGTKSDAVVETIELRTGNDGIFRRPSVSFAAGDGTAISAAPPMYRKRYSASTGSVVKISYSPRDPHRIAVHKFCFRVAELASVLAGLLLIAVSIESIYR